MKAILAWAALEEVCGCRTTYLSVYTP